MDINTVVEKINLCVNNELPGAKAQNKMLAIPRVPVNLTGSEEHAMPSAVLILLYQDGDEVNFILTERTEDVQHHKGQISLPGGSWEEGEKLFETAIRETEEEIGVTRNDIKIIGSLTPLFVKVTKYMIHPFVGYLDYVPKLVPHSGEVSDDFSVGLTDLLDNNNIITELWTIRGAPVDVPFFKFGKHQVWGATAMILSEFRDCIEAKL